MISINGIENTYVIDLNESTDEVYTLSVDSFMGKISIPWNVSSISDIENISASLSSNSTLKIDVNINELKKDGVIVLKNLRKERINIILKHNIEASREKVYEFKLGKHTIDGKSITFNIISKENGKNEPWSIVYDGKPISYSINKTKTKVTFTLSMILATEFVSHIVLQQDNSGKEIEIKLKHVDSNSVELIKEAD